MEDIKNTLEEMIAEVNTKISWVHALGFTVESYKGFSSKFINGKKVELTLIENGRNSKAKDKPRFMWKIDNKRVKAAEVLNLLK